METINQRPERTHQHFPLLEIMGRYNANLANEQPGWQRVFFPSALSSSPPTGAAQRPPQFGAPQDAARCQRVPARADGRRPTGRPRTGTRLRGAGRAASRGDPVLSASVGKPPSSALPSPARPRRVQPPKAD